MFDKFSRSWTLVKASAAVLRADRELMLFPVISSMATLVVLATFAAPAFVWRMFANGIDPISLAWALLFYFCQYSVIIFFNCALVGAAMIRLQGGDPTLADGMAVARSRIRSILGYAAIAATVGVLLQSLKNQDNFFVRLLGGGLGVAWTLGTFLVVPVMVSQDIGPIDALKKSVSLLRRTWGENAIGTVGLGFFFGLLSFAVVIAGALLAYAALQVSSLLALAVVAIFVIGLLLLGVYQAALSGVYSAALYRYADDGVVPLGFQGAQLERAFAAK
ncbi:MAG: DUF6159 family protein [Pseudomonadota bacterium]|nr:DUF6159 family protein [Pseudomonadota bacterium]